MYTDGLNPEAQQKDCLLVVKGCYVFLCLCFIGVTETFDELLQAVKHDLVSLVHVQIAKFYETILHKRDRLIISPNHVLYRDEVAIIELFKNVSLLVIR